MLTFVKQIPFLITFLSAFEVFNFPVDLIDSVLWNWLIHLWKRKEF